MSGRAFQLSPFNLLSPLDAARKGWIIFGVQGRIRVRQRVEELLQFESGFKRLFDKLRRVREALG